MMSNEIVMTRLLDIDQLRTFVAIAETGSFTRAAAIVHKTQSAVSMQMKRLEERLHARKIVRLNVDALASFDEAKLIGHVRLGVPDDYADRYLPEIMARFSRVYPGAELSVLCEPSVDLLQRIDSNELDLAIVTNSDHMRRVENFRRERLLWVTSARHAVHTEEPLPLALGRPSCAWRQIATDRLESVGRSSRLLYSSSNAGAVAAAVLSGLAVSVLPESGLRPGMRILNTSDGFPDLPPCHVGLLRNLHETSVLADALADYIIASLANLTMAAAAE